MLTSAACNICFLKTLNFRGVQKYLFGINALKARLREEDWGEKLTVFVAKNFIHF